jgi:hypothetical protein
MSTYRRAATRVVVLCTLIAGMVLAKPTPASAFTCSQDCNAAYIACIQICHSQPDPFGCEDQCGADRAECLSAC